MPEGRLNPSRSAVTLCRFGIDHLQATEGHGIVQIYLGHELLL